jgi:hypothetical protein
VEQVDGRPEQIVEVRSSRVSLNVATRASKMSTTAPAMILPSGSGRGSGWSSKGR